MLFISMFGFAKFNFKNTNVYIYYRKLCVIGNWILVVSY